MEFVLGFQEIGSVRARMGEKISAVVGNPNTTVAMRLQDPNTGRFSEDVAGKAQVAQVAQQEIANDVSGGYRPPRQASIQSTNRINWLDLRDLKDGQSIIHYGNRRIHANCAFFKAKTPIDVRYNQLLMIDRPKREEVRQHVATLDRIATALRTRPIEEKAAALSPALVEILSTYAGHLADGVDPVRASLDAVLSCPPNSPDPMPSEHHAPSAPATDARQDEASGPSGSMLSDLMQGASDEAAAAGPFPDPGRLPKAYDQIADHFGRIERLGGAKGEAAKQAARQVIGAYREASAQRGSEELKDSSRATLIAAITAMRATLDEIRSNENSPRPAAPAPIARA